MTPKLKTFVSKNDVATPFLALDLDHVATRYRAMARAMPWGEIYYAVKANPASPILESLVRLGSRFDAASIEEVRQCLAAGAKGEQISFGNPLKKSSAIAEAAALGVRLFVFDSAEELEKIALHAPGAQVYTRLAVDNSGSDWPLSQKFGASSQTCISLLKRAATLGLMPYGLSFHVGSQQTDPRAYADAIAESAKIFRDLAARGIALKMLNLGGGFPANYKSVVPPIDAFAQQIDAALTAHFGACRPVIMSEPGRYLVAEAGIVCSEVILSTIRDLDGHQGRWLYLDIGRFGGLAETEDEAIRYDIAALDDSGPSCLYVIAGPTCDGVDVLYRKHKVMLPENLREGNRVVLMAAGAYVSTYCSQSFNGLAPLSEHYL